MDGICASDNSDSGSHTQFLETVMLLEKAITCPVCLEIFNEPKTLSCLHTYCKTCIGNLIQARANNGGDIHCPECREIVPVSDNDASKFPTSFLVNSLIDTFKNFKKASDPSTLCENCGKDKVAAYCSECALHICASCVGCHKTMKVFAGHNVMKGGEVLSTKQLAANNIIKFLCPKHKMKQLELYCQSCEKLICLNCTIVDHKGHVFDFVESLAAVFKTEVHSAVGGIVDKEQSIQQAIVNVEKVKEELTQQGNGLAHSICHVFGQLESTLQKEKEALLQQTKHMVEKKIGFLSTQAEMLLISQTAFKSLQRFIEETSKNSCDEEFVSIKSQITARVRELDDKYRDLALEPKIQATIKYQTSFCTTSAGHQISVAVQDSEVACTPVHVNVAMKSSLQDDEPMNETPHKKNDTQKEGNQTKIIQASPPDTGTQSQIACGSLAPDCTAPAPHVPAGTAPAVDVLDGPDSTKKIVQKKKGRNHSSNILVSAPQPGTGAQFQIAQVNWKGKEDKAEECPLQEKSSVKEVSWLDRSSRDADVPRDSWKERRDDDLPCDKPVTWRPRVVSLSSDNDGWRRGDGKISKERESDSGLYGSFSGDRDGDTNRPQKENVQTRERDGDSWRASGYKGCPKKQDGDVWRPSEDEEPPRKRDVGRLKALMKFSEENGAQLSIDRAPLNQIKLYGETQKCSKVRSQVQDVLHSYQERAQVLEKAEMLQMTVEWQRRSSDGTYHAYETLVNYNIENEFQLDKKEYVHQDKQDRFKINFEKNEEVDVHGTVTLVKRIDKTIEGYPPHWDPMPVNHANKEVMCHIVDIASSCQEYKDVIDAFSKTMIQGRNYNKVLKVQRIQNPTLYGQYIIRKRAMDKQNPQCQNERKLFHGTKVDISEKINVQGFNRSFSGRNATVYGLGTYFARDALYSAQDQYSTPDANGHKYMYLAGVLTGEYTLGKQNMIIPPAKDPTKDPNLVFESAVENISNPSIFVVFNDAQAYPEYLIIFC